MSVFNVFSRKDFLDYRYQFEGTREAGRTFKNYWVSGNPNAVFEKFIIGLIESGNVVTYRENDDNHVVYIKVVSRVKKLYYKPGGSEKKINIKAEEDKPNGHQVTMAVPSIAVDPDESGTATYLSNAITKLSDANIGASEKRAFLLGLLLLKRCR